MSVAMYYDGDHTIPFQTGPLVIGQDQFARSRIYTQKLRQDANYWLKATISMGGPRGGFLVEESKPRHIGGRLVEWERTFADVPVRLVLAETLTYPMQLVVTVAGKRSIVEIPVNTTCRATYDWFHTTTPWLIAFTRAFRLTQGEDTTYYVGTPIVPPVTFTPAQDSQVIQWKGNIYQRKNLDINVPALVASG
jgi:hypothetical protein